MDGNMLPGSTCSSPRKQKLRAMLLWTQSKLKEQNLKIKRLQAQGRRIKKRIIKVEDLLKEVKEKFPMTNENIASLQNLNVQVCKQFPNITIFSQIVPFAIKCF